MGSQDLVIARRVCAFCKAYQGLTMVAPSPSDVGQLISHTICDACAGDRAEEQERAKGEAS